MARAYVSIGSNIEKEKHVRAAVRALRQHYGTLTISRVYESSPVGFVGDNFYNLVVGFDTEESIDAVCAQLTAIEHANGRRRDGVRFGPRTLDLDLILYGDRVQHDGDCPLPRPEIREHAFVLRPLADIAPRERHPESGETYAAMAAAFHDPAQKLNVANFTPE